MSTSWCHYLIIYIAAGCLTVCAGVHISRLDVPSLVELGSREVILDCEYNFDNKNFTDLVVKWFFHNKTNPIYQWIHPQNPQSMGPFKGKVDLGYKASQDPYHSYRALKILNPDANMTGNYICVVSTFADEDFKSNSMLVFTPGKNFQFQEKKKEGDLVRIDCFAEDVYPKPIITITSQSNAIKEFKSEVAIGDDGLYDVVGTAFLKDADLSVPEELACQLVVSQANYKTTKQLIYYPGSGSSSILGETNLLCIFITLACLTVKTYIG